MTVGSMILMMVIASALMCLRLSLLLALFTDSLLLSLREDREQRLDNPFTHAPFHTRPPSIVKRIKEVFFTLQAICDFSQTFACLPS